MRQGFEALKEGVVRVGHGRGFLVAGFHEVLIITAASCLAKGSAASDASPESHSKALVGPLHVTPGVIADCLFADPFADLAVLRCPNEQSHPHQANAYEHLVAGASTFMVDACLARQAQDEVRREGLVLSLEGQWQPCRISCRTGGPLQITMTEGHLHPRMAGSPILSLSGGVLGVISGGGTDLIPTHSNLALDLPQKFLQWMTVPGLSSRMPMAMYP